MDLEHRPKIPVVVASMPGIMDGAPVVRGTRIPTMTIVAYLRDGETRRDIFRHYPTLLIGGIEAVERRVDENLEKDWRRASEAA